MKAVVCRNAKLEVVERPDPEPGRGQVMLRVLRCGICGSDLHALRHCDHWGELMEKSGYRGFMSSQEAVVLGHEFCGEVLEYGPGCARRVAGGARVCALPLRRQGDGIDLIGLSERSPGGYAERVVVEESMMLPVPNGLDTDLATLTEPMAIAWHAIRRSEVKPKDVAVVIGCGPVGLAVVSLLKARGVGTVVASDYSPGRRGLAQACGADVVVDPAAASPFASWAEHGFITGLPAALELAVGTLEKLEKLPVPWWHVWRAAEGFGLLPKRPIIFECVGVPGVLEHLIEAAPLFSRVVVVGVCMQTDRIEPALANNKEIDFRFVLGYTPLEFRDTLRMIAEGKVRCGPMLTGVVGLDGVENAFTALGDPEKHAKIQIDPTSSATEPAPLTTSRALA
jgi:threonine dehydrogenase-like Zn-dependent dehydrogenase